MSTAVTINDVAPKTQFTATNLQTVFSCNWTANATTDILVYARATGVEANDLLQLISTVDYSVTFIGGTETVRVTFAVGRTTGDIVTVVRNTPADRTNLYVNTNFTPSMLNNDFGIQTLVAQQNKLYDVNIAPRYQVSATIALPQDIPNSQKTGDTVLPILVANQIWAKNNANDAIIAYDVPASGGVAPKLAKYLVQTADAELPNSQAMGALASGLVVNTTTTGVQLTRVLTGTANQTTITNGSGISGNPTVAIAANPIIPGTEGIALPAGTTAERSVVPINGEFRYNTSTTFIEYYNGSVWIGLGDGGVVDSITGTANQINVDLTNIAIPILSLSSTLNLPGTFSIQGTTAVSAIINDSTLATASATNVSTAAAMKAYIDAVATGLNIQGSCVAGSTTALTVTYDNGASGVGATLTNAGVQAAISLDGVSPTAGQRVLIKNQASTFQNGIYTTTTVGSGATNWVLTRATDFDTPAEIQPGDLVILTGGTTQATSSWIQAETVVTVGTDAITFILFTVGFPVGVANGGTGLTSLATFRLLAGGTTSTGAMQQVVDGVAGTLLRSAGAGALATYTTTTYPATNDLNTIMFASTANVLGVITPANSSILITSAGGVPSWQTTLPAGLTYPGSGGLKSFQVFTSGAALTYTKPANITSILVEVVGGGGGGGGVAGAAASLQMGGGGGSGGYTRLWVPSAAATYTYTVGAAGAGGASGNNPGTSGSTTTFSASSLQATGGSGGTGSAAVSNASGASRAGGAGGSASNGNLNSAGGAGQASFFLSGIGHSGGGGNSIYGGGGMSATGTGAGAAALNYGSGGAGAGSTTTNLAGGSGSAGLIVVWEFA